MKISKHLKIAGSLQIVLGLLALIPGAFYVAEFFKSPRVFDGAGFSELIPVMLFFTSAFLCGGAQVWFGYALVRQKQWTTQVGGFICCALGFLHPPGMVISGYTLWFLIQARSEGKTPPPIL